MRRNETLQECIDFILSRAAQLRNARGPDDDVVKRLAKALATLTGASAQTTPTGKRRTHAGQTRYTGKVGRSVVDIWYDPANVREEEGR